MGELLKWYVNKPSKDPSDPNRGTAPLASPSAECHDVLDDDYWFDQRYRAPALLGFLPIEELEKQLKAVASAEYQRRADLEPEERWTERMDRERRLRELVLQANETDSPDLWRQTDGLVFGQDGPAK